MKFFIAVVFFCVGGECNFWKSDTNFYNLEECAAEIKRALQFLDDQSVAGSGTCLPISTKNDI